MTRTHETSPRSSIVRRGLIPLIAGLGLLIVGIIIYSLSTGNRMVRRYTPLVDAAMEIKLEIAMGHLWFEEIISGDKNKDIAEAWEHLNQSEWYARAMLEGGENQKNRFFPVDDPALRRAIEHVLVKISDFRNIAEQRLAMSEQAGIGSDIDQRFDAIFEQCLDKADRVEQSLQSAIARELNRFHTMQGLLIAICVVLAAIIIVLLRGYERRQSLDTEALRESEEWYRTLFEYAVDAIVLFDPENGAMIEFNKRAYENLGYNRAEFEKLTLADIEVIESAEDTARHMKKIVEAGSDTFETKHRHKNGEILHGFQPSQA